MVNDPGESPPASDYSNPLSEQIICQDINFNSIVQPILEKIKKVSINLFYS
jgi:hypothetical protein